MTVGPDRTKSSVNRDRHPKSSSGLLMNAYRCAYLHTPKCLHPYAQTVVLKNVFFHFYKVHPFFIFNGENSHPCSFFSSIDIHLLDALIYIYI